MDGVCNIRPDIVLDHSRLEKTQADILTCWNPYNILHRSVPCLEPPFTTYLLHWLNTQKSEIDRGQEVVVPPNFFTDDRIQFRRIYGVPSIDMDVMDAKRHGRLREHGTADYYDKEQGNRTAYAFQHDRHPGMF